MPKRGQVSGGFAALELMAACLVLALCLVPVLEIQLGATRQGGFSGGDALALARASALLEVGASVGLEELLARRSRGEPLVTASSAGLRTAGLAVEGEVVELRPVAPGLACLFVEVTWRAGREVRTHTLRRFRLVGRPDLGWVELPADRGEVAD